MLLPQIYIIPPTKIINTSMYVTNIYVCYNSLSHNSCGPQFFAANKQKYLI